MNELADDGFVLYFAGNSIEKARFCDPQDVVAFVDL